MPDPSEIAMWMKALALSRTMPPVPDFVRLAGEAPLRVLLEVRRFEGSAKVTATALRSSWPEPAEPTQPWETRRETPGQSVSWSREDASLLVCREEGSVSVEWTRALPIIPATLARQMLSQLSALEPFATLIEGTAVLTSWGIGYDVALGELGLVGIHRDLDRLEQDEADLRAAGFAESDEEGSWVDASGRTLVFFGGTVYGYVAPVPQDRIGGYPEHPGTGPAS